MMEYSEKKKNMATSELRARIFPRLWLGNTCRLISRGIPMKTFGKKMITPRKTEEYWYL